MSAREPDPARIRELAGRMARWQPDMVRELAALCAIPSVAGSAEDGAPYGRETRRALEHFLALGRQLGFDAVNLDNRAGYVEFGSGEHLVAALCHLDVVPAGDGWDGDAFTPQILPDRLIARGAADDKGPAIAVLYAMKDLLEQGYKPRGRLRLIVGLDEERGSSCMAHYVKTAQLPDAGFTPDADFPVIYAEKGLCWVTFTVAGGQPPADPLRLVAARGGASPNMIPGSCTVSFAGQQDQVSTGKLGHASMPWLGRNAISLAMREADRRLAEAGCSHPFVRFYQAAIGDSWRGEGLNMAQSDESGPLTFNAGSLRLEDDRAVLTADIRYPVSCPFEQLEQTMRETAERLGARVTIVKNIPPLYLPRDSFLVRTLNAVYNRLTGSDAEPVAIGGGTYARTMPNVAAFGAAFPGQPETAHQAGEYVRIDQLLATAAIYRQALSELSAPSAGA
ncbi:MAG: M20 family metallopeptidase [Clostridiaceae bacterium]|jgi:succinyl-diaminopimelate desuccinylase|nr:M20 family metallopeptidase [Clostridiaceae bacterium]